jgi:hypothetical protein
VSGLLAAVIWNRTVKKPIEYPRQILRVLYQHYKETGDLVMEVKALRELTDIPDSNLHDALKIVMEKGRIEEGIEGQPYFTYIAGDGSHSIITLSAKGISAGQKLTQSRYQKVSYYFLKYLLQIIIGVVIIIIATCIAHFLFG